MTNILTINELLLVHGGNVMVMFSRCWDGAFPHDHADRRCPPVPVPPPPPPPACKCLDYNDRSFPGPEVKTMNDCWEFCCRTNDIYHAAKFGKYPRDC